MRQDCHQTTGRCVCKRAVTGDKCDRCLDPEHSFPRCISNVATSYSHNSIHANDITQSPNSNLSVSLSLFLSLPIMHKTSNWRVSSTNAAQFFIILHCNTQQFKLVVKSLLQTPPHLNHVAALPCEIFGTFLTHVFDLQCPVVWCFCMRHSVNINNERAQSSVTVSRHFLDSHLDKDHPQNYDSMEYCSKYERSPCAILAYF